MCIHKIHFVNRLINCRSVNSTLNIIPYLERSGSLLVFKYCVETTRTSQCSVILHLFTSSCKM